MDEIEREDAFLLSPLGEDDRGDGHCSLWTRRALSRLDPDAVREDRSSSSFSPVDLQAPQSPALATRASLDVTRVSAAAIALLAALASSVLAYRQTHAPTTPASSSSVRDFLASQGTRLSLGVPSRDITFVQIGGSADEFVSLINGAIAVKGGGNVRGLFVTDAFTDASSLARFRVVASSGEGAALDDFCSDFVGRIDALGDTIGSRGTVMDPAITSHICWHGEDSGGGHVASLTPRVERLQEYLRVRRVRRSFPYTVLVNLASRNLDPRFQAPDAVVCVQDLGIESTTFLSLRRLNSSRLVVFGRLALQALDLITGAACDNSYILLGSVQVPVKPESPASAQHRPYQMLSFVSSSDSAETQTLCSRLGRGDQQ